MVDDARASLAWLKACGIGAVVVPGPKSPEFWKDFVRPSRFEGILPLVWRELLWRELLWRELVWLEDDTSIYRVPRPNPSLAHMIPEPALVRIKPRNFLDVGEIERFAAALDSELAVSARFGGTAPTPASWISLPQTDRRSAFR